MIYALMLNLKFKSRMLSNGGAGSDFASSRFEQRPQQIMRVRDTRFTDRELMTISETIGKEVMYNSGWNLSRIQNQVIRLEF